MKKFLVASIALACMVFIQCSEEEIVGIVIPNEPYEHLSDYNFFQGNIEDLNPDDRVVPYDLNSPLFSDYSQKARFVWMPEGMSAKYTTDHVLDFPLGAVLIKNFFYNHDEQDLSKGRRIIETRLLVNRGDEWDAYGYIWNEDQTDAYFEVIGDIKDVAWINGHGTSKELDYIIPNKNQCKGCHAYDGKQKPIGPKVRNLNKEYAYKDGEMNQLDKWAAVGYLSGYESSELVPSVAVWDENENYTVHERSMAYLDINCGHCHNEKGAANTSGLHLMADSDLGLTLGVYKATVSAGGGTGGHTYSIVPGNPEESIMIYRMKSDNPGAMMPELGRRLVHDEGVGLIAQWIREMEVDESLIPTNSSLN
jgi:uncharacterized repeat protein (TIGR03806 family)